MKSTPRGKSTSRAEVTHISEHGLWVLVDGHEKFMPFANFPWFRKASIDAVLNVEVAGPGHLYWPDLDVDLAVDSIDHPERFPLVSRSRSNGALQQTAGTGRRRCRRSTLTGTSLDPMPVSRVQGSRIRQATWLSGVPDDLNPAIESHHRYEQDEKVDGLTIAGAADLERRRNKRRVSDDYQEDSDRNK
jgi:hypothetical protein